MKIYLAAFLAIASLELFHMNIVRGSVGSQIMSPSSCVNLRLTEIKIRRLSDYEIKSTPVKAVIFITRNGVKICVPHDLPWVQNTMKKLDQKKKRKPRATLRPKPTTS
ncbi:hypothetical protein lerEdw1_012389 [Lerista edwardsae]|nr:hypothetical protein lerEdw1_012389 [Lerista edwardsae]